MPASTTPLTWSIQQVKTPHLTVLSARLEFEVFLRSRLSGLHVLCEQAWLDTGAPLSIVPFHVHNGRLDWTRIPGAHLTWAGQVCDLGTIEAWLPVQETPALRGPLTLLAKFPRSDPPGAAVPILIGLEFLLSHQSGVDLQPPNQASSIRLP